MKKFFTLVLGCIFTLGGYAQYQVQNSGFEEWESVSFKKNLLQTFTGNEPVYWNSFLDAEGDLKKTGVISTTPNQLVKVENDSRPNSTGSVCAKISANSILGVVAQGNLTTGCINMGSMKADEAKSNYNYTKIGTEGKNQPFTGFPDAMRVWVKASVSGTAKATTILHTNGYYQDPIANEITAKLVATATDVTIETKDGDWQELIIPFTYNEDVTERPAYALVSFSTSSIPGEGNDADYMYIDDLEYLYYSELNSLKYDGVEYYAEGKTTYTIDAVYDDSKLAITSNGHGATIERNYDKSTAILTITVKGDNISEDETNYHTYTVQFNEEPQVVETTTYYTNPLAVWVNGNRAIPSETTIELIQINNENNYSFVLKNFILFITEDDLMLVGTIRLNNLEILQDGSISTEQTINILPGDLEGTTEEDWAGPFLGDIPVTLKAYVSSTGMTTVIDIYMASLKQTIKVVFAPEITIDGTSAVSTEAGYANVTLTRQFLAGWNTVCLPFATTPEALGATKAEEFTGYSGNKIYFTEVTAMEANKPYLVQFNGDMNTTLYFGTEVEAASPVAVAHDGATFQGSYAASMSMAGLYGVANDAGQIMLGGESSTLGSTRAYFDITNGSGVNAISIVLDGEATAIESISADTTATFDVYTLSGVKVRKNASDLSGLQKGIYIVNGKKCIVK